MEYYGPLIWVTNYIKSKGFAGCHVRDIVMRFEDMEVSVEEVDKVIDMALRDRLIVLGNKQQDDRHVVHVIHVAASVYGGPRIYAANKLYVQCGEKVVHRFLPTSTFPTNSFYTFQKQALSSVPALPKDPEASIEVHAVPIMLFVEKKKTSGCLLCEISAGMKDIIADSDVKSFVEWALTAQKLIRVEKTGLIFHPRHHSMVTGRLWVSRLQ